MNPHLEWIRSFLLRKSSFHSNYKPNLSSNNAKSSLFNNLMAIRYRLLKPGTSEFIEPIIYSITISCIDPNFPFEKSNFPIIRSYLCNFLPDASISIQELESKTFTKSHLVLCQLILQFYVRYAIKPSTISPTCFGLDTNSYEDAFSQWGRSICNTEMPYLPADFMIDFGTAQVVAVIISKIHPSLISLTHVTFARNLSDNEISKNWREVGTALSVMDIHVPNKLEWGNKECLLCFAVDLFRSVYNATHSSNNVHYQMQVNQQMNQPLMQENAKDLNRIDFLIGQLNSISKGNSHILLSSPIESNPILLQQKMLKEQQEQEQQLMEMQLRLQQEQQQEPNRRLQAQVCLNESPKIIDVQSNNLLNAENMLNQTSIMQNSRVKIVSKPKAMNNIEVETKTVEDELIGKRSRDFKKLHKLEKLRKLQQIKEIKEKKDEQSKIPTIPQYKTLSSFAIDPSFPNQAKITTSKELIKKKKDDIQQYPINEMKKQINQDSSIKVSYVTFDENNNTNLAIKKKSNKHHHKHSGIIEEQIFDTVINANQQINNSIATNSKDIRSLLSAQKEGFTKEIKNRKHAVDLLESIYQYIEQERKELANASLMKEIEQSTSRAQDNTREQNEISNPIAIFDVDATQTSNKKKSKKEYDDNKPKDDQKQHKTHSSNKKKGISSKDNKESEESVKSQHVKEVQSSKTLSKQSHQVISKDKLKVKSHKKFRQENTSLSKDPFDTSIDFSKNSDLFDSDITHQYEDSNSNKIEKHKDNQKKRNNREFDHLNNIIDDPLLLMDLEKNSNEPSTKSSLSTISGKKPSAKSNASISKQAEASQNSIDKENNLPSINTSQHKETSTDNNENSSTISIDNNKNRNTDTTNPKSSTIGNKVGSFTRDEEKSTTKNYNNDNCNTKDVSSNDPWKSEKQVFNNPVENDSELTFGLSNKPNPLSDLNDTSKYVSNTASSKAFRASVTVNQSDISQHTGNTIPYSTNSSASFETSNPNKQESKEQSNNQLYKELIYSANNNEDSSLQELKNRLLNDFSQNQTGLDFSMQTDFTFPDIPSLNESTLQISDKLQNNKQSSISNSVQHINENDLCNQAFEDNSNPKVENHISNQNSTDQIDDSNKPKTKDDLPPDISIKEKEKAKRAIKPVIDKKKEELPNHKDILHSKEHIHPKSEITQDNKTKAKDDIMPEVKPEVKSDTKLKSNKKSKSEEKTHVDSSKTHRNDNTKDKRKVNDDTKIKDNIESITAKQKISNNCEADKKKNPIPIPLTNPQTSLSHQLSKMSNQKSESLTPADLSIGPVSSINSNIIIREENIKQETNTDSSHLNHNNDLSIELNSSEVEASSSKQKSSSNSLIFEADQKNNNNLDSKSTNSAIETSHLSAKIESAVDDFIPEKEKNSQEEKSNQPSISNISNQKSTAESSNDGIKKFHSSSSSSDSIPFKIITNDSKDNKASTNNQNDDTSASQESENNEIISTQNKGEIDLDNSLRENNYDEQNEDHTNDQRELSKANIPQIKNEDSKPLTSLIEDFDLSSLKSDRRRNRNNAPIQAISGPIKLNYDPVPKAMTGKGQSSETRRVSFDLTNLAQFQASLSVKHQANLKTLANLNNTKSETDSLSFPLSPKPGEVSDNNDIDTFMSTISFNQSGTIPFKDRLNMFAADSNELSLSLTNGEPEIVKLYRDASSANVDKSYIWLADDEQAILEGMLPTIAVGVELKAIQAYVANELKLKMNNSTVKRITANLIAFLRNLKKT